MSVTVFTLFDPSYERGAAALLNSLIGIGFSGRFVAFHRGATPTWLVGGTTSGACQVQHVRIEDPRHFAWQKAAVAMDLLRANPDHRVVYVDPDVLMIGSWTFLERWLSLGHVALVEEVINFRMTERHPLRQMWAEWLRDRDLPVQRLDLPYVNSGFFAVGVEHLPLLENWALVLELANLDGHGVNVARRRDQLFATWDQDALNIALMMDSSSTSILGPEGMGFMPGGYTMLHAVGRAKPWDRAHVREALAGRRPRRVDQEYVRLCSGPFVATTRFERLRQFWSVRTASAIGRLLSR